MANTSGSVVNRQIAPTQSQPRIVISRLKLRRNIIGWLFIMPWFLGFLIFTLGPFLSSLWLSFTDWELIGPANLGRRAQLHNALCRRSAIHQNFIQLSLLHRLLCSFDIGAGLFPRHLAQRASKGARFFPHCLLFALCKLRRWHHVAMDLATQQ